MKDKETDNEERLIDAAGRLFAEKGYSETSIDDICEEVSVTHGLFYYYFDSKEDVVEAITTRLMEDITETLEEITNDPILSAQEKFMKLWMQSLQEKKEKSYLTSVLMGDTPISIFVNQVYHDAVEAMVPYLKEIVEQGVEEGVFDTEFPEQTMRFWIHGRLHQIEKAPWEGDIHEVFKTIKAEAHIVECLLGAKENFLTSFYDEHEDEIKKFLKEAKESI